MLGEHELNGKVHRFAGVPEFRLPAYLCFPTKVDPEPLALALDTIRRSPPMPRERTMTFDGIEPASADLKRMSFRT